MRLSRPAKLMLLLATVATLVFMYLPLAVVARLSFNPAKSVAWPGWWGSNSGKLVMASSSPDCISSTTPMPPMA